MVTRPDVELAFLGAALIASASDRDEPLALVDDADLENVHAAAVLAVLRELCCAHNETDAVLIQAELIRRGAPLPQHAALRDAVTSGACGPAVRHYGAAVVAASLRRHLASAGRALQELAESGSEADLVDVAERCWRAARDIRRRLARLRRSEL